MSASTIAIQPAHPSHLDDEIVALALQLEEIGIYSESSKGKHAVDSPPDLEVAFSSFQKELEELQTFLNDRKLAQSIGSAVHTDGTLITNITMQDVQAQEDRRFALDVSREDPGLEAPPAMITPSTLKSVIDDWMSTATETLAANSVVDFSDDESSIAGPSKSFHERQAEVLGKMSTGFQCIACAEQFQQTFMIKVKCGHRYCVDCVKNLFMLSTKDVELFPPHCCKQDIPLELIAKKMTPDELSTFQTASIEYSTIDRVYCSNLECAKFILPDGIEAGTHRARCEHCWTSTCAICTHEYHPGKDCPSDPDIQATRDLAQALGWQTCNRCGSIVQLRSGCNHMRCRCKAEFCYVCGVKWKNCTCDVADINRIIERAEEVVDRDAGLPIPRVERQRRIREVQAVLQENHECEHPGRFQRIFNGTRRRPMRCELCDNSHWKYLLQCRQCYINVCEDCRRNRI